MHDLCVLQPHRLRNSDNADRMCAYLERMLSWKQEYQSHGHRYVMRQHATLSRTRQTQKTSNNNEIGCLACKEMGGRTSASVWWVCVIMPNGCNTWSCSSTGSRTVVGPIGPHRLCRSFKQRTCSNEAVRDMSLRLTYMYTVRLQQNLLNACRQIQGILANPAHGNMHMQL